MPFDPQYVIKLEAVEEALNMPAAKGSPENCAISDILPYP